MRRYAHCRSLWGLLLLAPGLAAAQNEKPVDITGDWIMTAETPAGTFTSKLHFERNGVELIGRTTTRQGTEAKLNHVKLAGKMLTFDRDIQVMDMMLHLVYTGTVDTGGIKGTFEANGQTLNWSALRPNAAPPAAARAPSPAGTWKLQVDTPNGTRERTLVVQGEGDHLTGTITGPTGQVTALQDVSFKDRQLRFTMSMERDGATVKRTFVATLDGESLSGKIEGGNLVRSFTGRRESAPMPAAVGIAGTWKLVVQGPEHTYHPTLVLTEEGGKFGGKLQPEGSPEAALKDLTVKGNQVEFAADINVGGQEIHLQFTGTIEGDKLKGTMTAGDSNLPTTGDRQPKP
jgi:hypothetical protein